MITLTLTGQTHTLADEDARLLALALTSLTTGDRHRKTFRVRSSAFRAERTSGPSHPHKSATEHPAGDVLTDC
ncbi:hypothetical protein [Mangrovibacter phragmitis]|uniref:hypothetical protein n=1 Tax=Mangrovibacter phragmitis TaxID=1691903 RepID=UPI00336AC581